MKKKNEEQNNIDEDLKRMLGGDNSSLMVVYNKEDNVAKSYINGNATEIAESIFNIIVSSNGISKVIFGILTDSLINGILLDDSLFKSFSEVYENALKRRKADIDIINKPNELAN